MAKLTMRLVAGQDAARALQCVVSHLESFSNGAIRVEIVDQSVGGSALRLPVDSDVVRLVERAVERGFGVKPTYIWEGASIPIIPALADASGASPVLVGFGLDIDDIHSPNESFSLEQFKQGYTFVHLFLREVASA
jgi:acetylornithine deacetylase/succinyl-diaminopimelate desuccinylase-like protein